VDNRFWGEIVRKKGLKAMRVDNLGFKIHQASVWCFLKWTGEH